MDRGLSFLKNGGTGVNYCRNYGSSKLLLHFSKYCLDQLNNKHMKAAVNLTMQLFKATIKRNMW